MNIEIGMIVETKKGCHVISPLILGYIGEVVGRDVMFKGGISVYLGINGKGDIREFYQDELEPIDYQGE